MSKYHMVSGGDGGYGETVYADCWGNIVSYKEVEKERLIEQIAREVNKPKPAVMYINPDACPQCKALNNKAKICPYCGYERR